MTRRLTNDPPVSWLLMSPPPPSFTPRYNVEQQTVADQTRLILHGDSATRSTNYDHIKEEESQLSLWQSLLCLSLSV